MPASEFLDRFLPVDEVEHVSGYSRTTIWRHEREGLFPRRVKIGKARVGWLESEVREWIAARKAARGVRTEAAAR